MNHPHEDQLLLLAYGESTETQVEAHVATCDICREQLERFELARAALDWPAPARRRPVRWIATGLAAAAVAAVVLARGGARPEEVWQPSRAWSATAGYIAGGETVVEIDAQLTRLEQERTYVRP